MYLGQTKAGLHADFVETLILLQDVGQSQSRGGSWELLQRSNGLHLNPNRNTIMYPDKQNKRSVVSVVIATADLCDHIPLISELILPHEVSLLKLHLPQDGHVRVNADPQERRVGTAMERGIWTDENMSRMTTIMV